MAKVKFVVGTKKDNMTMGNYINHLMSIYNKDNMPADETARNTNHHDIEADTETSEDFRDRKKLFQIRTDYFRYENGRNKI